MRASPGWWRRLCAAGAAAPGGERGDPGCVAALAEIAASAGDAGARSPAACARMRARRYDAIVDTPGPAALGTDRALRARAAGTATTAGSIREPLASLFYDVRHRVSCDLHAIARNRMLTGLALGYAPRGPAGFRARPRALGADGGERYAVLLHATARPRKAMAGSELDRARQGARRAVIDLVLPWGTEAERARSGRHRRGGAARARARARAARCRGAADRRRCSSWSASIPG